MNAIQQTDFNFPGQNNFYRGKVRDVYYFGDLMALVASDRISAFDVILPEAIPFKGQVLTQIAARNLEATRDICLNWLIESPDPNVAIGYTCKPFAVEMVIRGYLAGHAWREYREGKRTICGVTLPDHLRENDKLPEPIITPTTKAMEGHDEDISRENIIAGNIVPEEDYVILEKYTRDLFKRGTELALEKGLILVDTKYEFGKHGDQITLIDEVHTPDSSRYFYLDGYAKRQANKEEQKQLSKEFVRQWLISEGFQGKEGQQVPKMTASVVNSISERYLELYEKFTGSSLQKQSYEGAMDRIKNNINESISRLRG